jgi:amino acid transporter
MATGTDTAANKLRRDSIGLALLTFMVISAAAPLTGIAGAMPIAMLLGNGAGIPGTFIIMTVIMLVWAFGFVALARRVSNAGAFYAYSSRALGGRVGGAVALIAVLSYNCMMVGLLGLFGGIAAGVFGGFGLTLPWWAWSLLAALLIGILGYRQVELSARVLMVLVALEYAIALIISFAILEAGGAGSLTYNLLDPALLTSGGLAASILFTFGSFIGIEATAIYAEEVRDAERTVPRATYASVVLIGLFYVVTTWLMVVGTGVDKLVPTIGALQDPTSYYFILASQYAGDTVSTIAGILLVTSIFASATAMHNFIARYLYVGGREGILPAALGVTHAVHKSPHAGSLAQTVVALAVVILFAVLGLDPILNLFTWIAQISVLGVLTMMAVTSSAVIAYFRREPDGASALQTLVAPLASGLVMAALALYVLFAFGPSTSTTPPLSIVFPALVPAFGIIGYLVAARLAAADPRRFAALGANQWATTDAVAAPGSGAAQSA